MPDVITNVASMVSPPRAGKVQQVAVTTTGANTALNTAFPGKWVFVYCVTGSAYFLFGPSTMSVVDAGASSGATLGKYITAGEGYSFLLDTTDTTISCDSAASATLEISLSGR